MSADHIKIEQRAVTTVAPSDTTEINLRLIDWRRIYRKVSAIYPGFSGRELIAGVSWGITTSCLGTLIPIYQTIQPVPGLQPWVKPGLWLTAGFSLVFGLFVWKGAKNYAKDVDAARDEITQDMEEVYRLYFPGEKLGGTSTVTPQSWWAKVTSRANDFLAKDIQFRKPKLEILSASYGEGKDQADVTVALAEKIRDSVLETQCGNHLGGDPCPGRRKKLSVIYTFKGIRGKKDFEENSLVKLPEI